jgi:hypothetical protein
MPAVGRLPGEASGWTSQVRGPAGRSSAPGGNLGHWDVGKDGAVCVKQTHRRAGRRLEGQCVSAHERGMENERIERKVVVVDDEMQEVL